MKKVLMILLSILVLTGCEKTDGQKFKEEYEALNGTEGYVLMNIDSNAKIEYLDAKKTISFLKEGTGIIYFGFPSCPWCRNAFPVLLEVASSNNMTISYLNPSGLRKSKSEEYLEIMDILKEYLEENEDGEKVLYVPDIYFVKDGKIIGHHLGTVESQDNPTIPLTEEQHQELKTIFENLANQIK